MDVALSP
jgi:hypothetical protein